MIKCYHARRTHKDHIFEVPLIATIYSDKEDVDIIWDCCNNSCWWNGSDYLKMKEYNRFGTNFRVDFTSKYWGYCNDDLIIEMGGKYYCSLPMGWKELDTLESAIEFCRQNSHFCRR